MFPAERSAFACFRGGAAAGGTGSGSKFPTKFNSSVFSRNFSSKSGEVRGKSPCQEIH